MINAIQSFLKIGFIGFGGGSALIPVVEKEFIENKKSISKERYSEHVIVSNITPGALPVKLASLIGHDIGNDIGMLIGAFSIALPGVLGLIAILSVISTIGGGIVHQIEYASIGISIFIIFLLIQYIRRTLRELSGESDNRRSLWIMMFSLIITFGNEWRSILINVFGENPILTSTPIFDLKTIDVLILAFFIIFFTKGKKHIIKTPVTIIIGTIFVFIFGKKYALQSDLIGIAFKLFMLFLVIFSTMIDSGNNRGFKKAKINYVNILVSSAFFIIPIIIITVIATLRGINITDYIINGIISTATSFGGGEAYLTVASDIFVGGNVVTGVEFYGQIVPVANALPGPILVKILAGVGFITGFNEGGIINGYILAALGFVVSVGVTCILCIIINSIYHAFSDLPIFSTLKECILPVICGLLISTMLSMLVEIFKVSVTAGTGTTFICVMSLSIFVLIGVLHKKYRIHDIFVVILAGGISTIIMNFI